jgi:hypothetical protein
MLTDLEYVAGKHERAIQALNRLKYAYNDMENMDCVDQVHNLIVKLEKIQSEFEEVK